MFYKNSRIRTFQIYNKKYLFGILSLVINISNIVFETILLDIICIILKTGHNILKSQGETIQKCEAGNLDY